MSTKQAQAIFIFLILASASLSAWLYPYLPEQVASHWNAAGQVNGTMSRFWGVFLMPTIMLAILGLYYAIPRIDPLKTNIDSFRKYYDAFWTSMFVFFFYIHALTLAWNMGHRFNFTIALVPAMSALFYTLGVLLENTKRNWFIGIRTPWTLSSDVVWDKTHKLGGKLFKITAVISLLGLLFHDGLYAILILVIPAAVIAVVTIVYSYLLHRREVQRSS